LQSSNNSFAGTSFRYNNITLDGAINNDAIGFSPQLGGQTSTANQPGSSTRTNSFSLDAIQQVQVQIAPYDVSLGNFTGGSVNAVSRSGSNEVEGSVYPLHEMPQSPENIKALIKLMMVALTVLITITKRASVLGCR